MKNDYQKNITWHKNDITRIKREKHNNHKSIVIWFTGLSGSGKSTIANAVENILFHKGIKTYLIDGDNIRSGLCSDLSFSTLDRKENIRRIGEMVKIMLDAGIVVLVSAISPYKDHRDMLYQILNKKDLIEVFVDTPLNICEKRDPKNLYKKARLGKISNFTGFQSLYEKPENPDLHLDGVLELQKNVKKVIKKLYDCNIMSFV